MEERTIIEKIHKKSHNKIISQNGRLFNEVTGLCESLNEVNISDEIL